MKTKIIFQLSLVILSTFFFISCKKNHPHFCNGDDTIVTTTKVFSTGFNNPRGLKFGPDGYLYVAEGGTGGNHFSTGCLQAPPAPGGPGPYMGNDSNSRISRIDFQGTRTTFVNYLPSCTTNPATGRGVSGMADVGFIGNKLYGLIGGGGCSHGVPNVPNGIVKATGNGAWNLVANYSAYITAHPGVNYDAEDYTPDGNPFSMVIVDNNFYVIEPNTGVLDKITLGGNVSRVADISATLGHIVPTAIAYHNGNFYVGNLNTFPAVPGSSSVYKITHDGQINVFATGFNMILSVTFDEFGGLYVLEMTTNNPGPTPGTGDIVRVDPSGSRQVITSGLHLPTAMTFGPDRKLYVSDWGIGPPGAGQILQISFKCDEVRGDTKGK